MNGKMRNILAVVLVGGESKAAIKHVVADFRALGVRYVGAPLRKKEG
jgi:hypothetical protein